MQEIVALFAPALVALGFYNHLHPDNLSAKKLIFTYGSLVVFINLCVQLVLIYLFGVSEVSYLGKDFINYLLLSIIFSVILPFVINLTEHTIAIEVKKNVHKKSQ